jgi:hypothetical protein
MNTVTRMDVPMTDDKRYAAIRACATNGLAVAIQYRQGVPADADHASDRRGAVRKRAKRAREAV